MKLYFSPNFFFHFLSFHLINFVFYLCIQSYFIIHVLSQGITAYLALQMSNTLKSCNFQKYYSSLSDTKNSFLKNHRKGTKKITVFFYVTKPIYFVACHNATLVTHDTFVMHYKWRMCWPVKINFSLVKKYSLLL